MAKKYYAQKDKNGFPIPGTVMSGSYVPTAKNLVEIPATTATGSVQSLHPEGMRYFVRTDVKGNIIPNSLLLASKAPAGRYVEFKIFKS